MIDKTFADVSRAVERACADLDLDLDQQAAVEMVLLALGRAAPKEEGLTVQESRLVAALRLGRGRVLDKEMLAEVVAAGRQGGDPDGKLVDVIVCKVRKKRPDLSPHIENVHGCGVRWVEAA